MSAARQPRREPPGPSTRVAAVLAARAGREHAQPGEALPVRVDRLLLDGPAAAAALRASGWSPPVGAGSGAGTGAGTGAGSGARTRGKGPRVSSPERLAVVAGAEQPVDERRALQLLARDCGFAVALEPARAGLPGVVAVEEGLIGSDDVVVGTSADVLALGALGCVPLRCGTAELAALLADPVLRAVVPATRFVTISGRLPRWSGGFDLALSVLDALGAEGPGAGASPGTVVPSHTVLQLGGPTIEALDLPGRLALCEALASAGQLAVIAPDRATRTWLAARRPSRREAGPAVHADPEAPPGAGGPGAGTRGSEAGAGAPGGEPALAVSAGDAAPGARSGGIGGRPVDLADAAKGLRIDEAWLVGRLEDLRAAAEVLRDRNARRGLLLAVVAASQRTLLHAIEEGLAADLLRAGATLLPPGSRPAPLARGACRVTSAMSASNAPGGPEEVLAGPAVVAASAVAGRVVEPETMRRAHRRATRVH